MMQRSRWRQLLQAPDDLESENLPVIGGNASVSGAPAAEAGVAGGAGGAAPAACTIPDDVGACEVYRIQYVARHWGSFVLVVLVDGEQAAQSPFRPFVFPPPGYPWFNSSSLQVLPWPACLQWPVLTLLFELLLEELVSAVSDD